MPEGTKVHKMYKAILRNLLTKRGMSLRKAQQRAAKIAQAKTGLALSTGRHPHG